MTSNNHKARKTGAMTLCPYCGAYSPRLCELEEDAGCCPWEESGEYADELAMAEDDEDTVP